MSTVLARPFLRSGTATFGYVFTPGSVRTGVSLIGPNGQALPTQLDRKRTWSDGSVKHGAITADIPADGVYDIVASTAQSSAPRSITWPNVSAVLTIQGVAWTAQLPNKPLDGALVFLDGPLVHEAQALVPVMKDSETHPSLRVRFDVRTYANGGYRVAVRFENILNVAATNLVTYDAAVKVDGIDAIPPRLGLPHHSFGTWREIIRIKLQESPWVKHDLEPFYQTQAIPRPLVEGTTNKVYDISLPKYGPMQIGDLTYPMAAPGGRPEFGPYPQWQITYLAHQTQNQYDYMIRHAELSGSWSMHISWTDDRPVTLDNVVSPRADQWTWGNGPGPVNKGVGRKWPPEIGAAHQPSLTYLPYLLTCDRFYLDEARDWCHYQYMSWGPFGREGKKGLIFNQQTRGIGWALRDLGDFLGFAPDDHPDRPYFLEKTKNNLVGLDVQADVAPDPLGSVRPTGSYLNSVVKSQLPQWQNNYLCWGLHRIVKQHGLFTDGTRMMQKLAQYQLDLFTHAPEFRREDAAEYWYYVCRHEDGTFFKDFGEMWRYNFQDINPSTGKPRLIPSPTLLPGYVIDARLAIMVAMDLGLPGAADAYAFIMQAKYPNVAPTAGWGILENFTKVTNGPVIGRSEFALAPITRPSTAPTVEQLQAELAVLKTVLARATDDLTAMTARAVDAEADLVSTRAEADLALDQQRELEAKITDVKAAIQAALVLTQ